MQVCSNVVVGPSPIQTTAKACSLSTGLMSSLTFEALLAEESLSHLASSLSEVVTLADAQALLSANRPAFLAKLKELGVSKLGERQKLANALSRAEKTGRVAAAVPVPHMRPCTWTQTDEAVTVKLLVAAGTSGRQIDFELDANSLSIRVGGELSSVAGRLAGLVKPTDSTWELERAPPAEPQPYEPASSQPQAEDLIVVTLVKSRPGEWPTLFQGGGRSMAKKSDELPNAPPPRLAPSEAPKERPNLESPIATRQPVPLGPGGGASGGAEASNPMAFVPRKLQLGGTTQQRRPAAAAQPTGGGGSGGGGASDANAPAMSAREHWVGESATLLWRDGASERLTVPDGPEPEGALFWWTEDAEAVRVYARTRRGLQPHDVKLELGGRSADLSVDGRATPWCGMLCGRIDAAASRVDVLPADATEAAAAVAAAAAAQKQSQQQQQQQQAGQSQQQAGQSQQQAGQSQQQAGQSPPEEEAAREPPCWDLLRLTLVKAERRLWVAPWPELLPQLLAQTQRRNLPPRHELLGSGYGDGWQTSQQRDSWTVVLPIKEGAVDADDVRVAVAADAFNLHLVGQEEMPLLAGELHGRVLPDRCSWKVRPAYAADGVARTMEVAVTLRKAEPANWVDLIKTWYI